MIQIDQKGVNLLRTLVSLPQREIETVFNNEIAAKRFDIKILSDYKLFLQDKQQIASEKYSASIGEVIRLIDRELTNREETEPLIIELCEALSKLNEEKARLELEIDTIKQQLKGYLRKGIAIHGRFKVTYRPGFPYLRVLKKSLLAEQFLSLQPDRKKIRKWFDEHGELLPGTELRTQRDTIIVRGK